MTINFRTRLILTHLAVIAVLLVVGGFIAYWLLSRAIHHQLDAALLAIAETEAAIVSRDHLQSIRLDEGLPKSAALSFERIDRLIQVVDINGNVLARSANLGSVQLPLPQQLVTIVKNKQTVFETLERFGDEPVRMVSLPSTRSDPVLIVQVAGSLDDVHRVLNTANLLFISMAVGLLAAVSVVGMSLTRKAFWTINAIVQRAQQINDTNLSERLPHPGSRDEIGSLVETLNDMLERIEKSFVVQKRFTSDASHELRSPLSRLQTELEISLRRPRDVDEYQAALQSCMEEVQRLTLIVEELLVLARMDAGLDNEHASPVSLDAIIQSTVKRFRYVADKRNIDIDVVALTNVTAYIARGRVDLILSNLLDNALKYSPAGGRITVALKLEGKEAALSVSDSGPGIGEDEQTHLFERFYRGTASTKSSIPGTGLGLALSQAIAQGMRGSIDCQSPDEGGSIFTFRFPLSPLCDDGFIAEKLGSKH